jgi:hypothetical protein
MDIDQRHTFSRLVTVQASRGWVERMTNMYQIKITGALRTSRCMSTDIERNYYSVKLPWKCDRMAQRFRALTLCFETDRCTCGEERATDQVRSARA